MSVAFELEGQPFTALNGGPLFNFNEAISLQIYCDTPVRLAQGSLRCLVAVVPVAVLEMKQPG